MGGCFGGATDDQKAIEREQMDFYKTMTQHFESTFANSQNILASLKNAWQPILSKGANQEGFSPEEKAVYNTQATERTAANYAQASAAAHRAQAAMGGSEVIPSGVNLKLDSDIAQAAAREQSEQQLGITQENYAQGRRNFAAASQALGGVAELNNPLGFSQSAEGAGGQASQSANEVAAADNAANPWKNIGGMLGGAADSWLTGGFASMMKPPKST